MSAKVGGKIERDGKIGYVVYAAMEGSWDNAELL
jgi:hypothetical protein